METGRNGSRRIDYRRREQAGGSRFSQRVTKTHIRRVVPVCRLGNADVAAPFPRFPSIPFVGAAPLSAGVVQMLLLSTGALRVFAVAAAPLPAHII